MFVRLDTVSSGVYHSLFNYFFMFGEWLEYTCIYEGESFGFLNGLYSEVFRFRVGSNHS